MLLWIRNNLKKLVATVLAVLTAALAIAKLVPGDKTDAVLEKVKTGVEEVDKHIPVDPQ